jgi:iron(III) transport system substrate-binding protein
VAEATLGWSIAYNTELRRTRRRAGWTCASRIRPKKIGQVIAPSGGTTWTRIMFERQVLGEDYWKKQAATQPILYPSGAPTPTRWCAANLDRGAALQHRLHQEARRRAGGDHLPAEACRSTTTRPASPRRRPTRTPPSCFLNWCMSDEGRPSRSRSSAISRR